MTRRISIISFYSTRLGNPHDFHTRRINEIPTEYTSLSGSQTQKALLYDSRNRCVYCEKQIRPSERNSPGSTTIEHWICQSHNPRLAANPGNLFATCDSRQYGTKDEVHCQQFRGQNGNRYFFPFFAIELRTLTNRRDFVVEQNLITSQLPLQFFQASIANSGNLNFTGAIEPSGYLHDHIREQLRQAISALNLNANKLCEARMLQFQLFMKSHNNAASFDFWRGKLMGASYSEFCISALAKYYNARNWQL